ncbi:hypothetical protein LCGC14_2325410, partial [marine sediment metagenome]
SGVVWINNTLAEAGIASASGLAAHLADTANPHSVTKAQVGLSVVENTALSTWPGTSNITTVGETAVTAHVAAINHDALLNFVAGEHFLQSAIVATGILNSGSITSGFGNIDIGSSTFDTTGAVSTGAFTATTGVFSSGVSMKKLVVVTPLDSSFTGGGSVGIGIAIPTSKLHVSSTGLVRTMSESTDTTGRAFVTAQASHGVDVFLDLRAHGTTYSETLLGLSMTGSVAVVGSPKANGMAIGTFSNFPLIFATNNTLRLAINSAGAADFQGNAVSMGALTATMITLETAVPRIRFSGTSGLQADIAICAFSLFPVFRISISRVTVLRNAITCFGDKSPISDAIEINIGVDADSSSLSLCSSIYR